MDIKQSLFGLTTTLLGISLASAGGIDDIAPSPSSPFHPVFSLQGGYASIDAGGTSKNFFGTDSEIFSYRNSNQQKNSGYIGLFVGVGHEPSILPAGFFTQIGVEYNYFAKTSLDGINTAGIEDSTTTLYDYHYKFQTQQLLGTFKLFATAYERFHPYGEVGIGAAFNRLQQYQVRTNETGAINLTPQFSHNRQTELSYILGVGIDAAVNNMLRVGLGYRYSYFGSSSLGNGEVVFNNYHASVPFNLKGSSAYANQLMAHIMYVF